MKIIILAAGKGSRLGNGEIPKPLTVLSSGKSILQQQLDHLASEEALVVVGYHQEMVREAFPGLDYVVNSQYAKNNTAKSLLLALREVHEDTLWLNGDVVFHPSIIAQVLRSPHTAMVVNKGDVGEEEVKYRSNGRGRILEVSKKVGSPEGEALGINLVKAKDVPLLRDCLEQCAQNDYFEKGVELAIQAGMEVSAIVVPQDHCVEVDFPEDLQKANHLLAQWNTP